MLCGVGRSREGARRSQTVAGSVWPDDKRSIANLAPRTTDQLADLIRSRLRCRSTAYTNSIDLNGVQPVGS